MGSDILGCLAAWTVFVLAGLALIMTFSPAPWLGLLLWLLTASAATLLYAR